MMERPILILDGSSLVYRAYYALPKFTTSQGKPTGATLGFLNMVTKLLCTYRPFIVIVAFDHPQKTFRHELHRAYKAQRKPMPEDLKPQLEDIEVLLGSMGFPVIERAGFEGDDLIGSAVEQLKVDHSIIVVTADLDLLQLVSGQVVLLQPVKGVTQLKKIDEEVFFKEWGLSPAQIVDVLALAGDPSDNIPGVPGIGEKTAAKLIQRFGSVEEILSHQSSLNPSLAQALKTYRARIEENLVLLKIRTDVPIEVSLHEWDTQKIQWDAFLRKLEELELKNLRKRMIELFGKGCTTQGKPSPSEVNTKNDLVTPFCFPSPHCREKHKKVEGEGKEKWCAPALLFVVYPFLDWAALTSFPSEQQSPVQEDLWLPYLYRSREWIMQQPRLRFFYENVELELLKLFLEEEFSLKNMGLYPSLWKDSSDLYHDLPLFGEQHDCALSFDHPLLREFIEEETRKQVKHFLFEPWILHTFYGWRFLANELLPKEELHKRYLNTLLDELIRLSLWILRGEMGLEVNLRGKILQVRRWKENHGVFFEHFQKRLNFYLGETWGITFLEDRALCRHSLLVSRKKG